MFERPDEDERELALRDGLHRLAVPAPPAADFDAAVLAALRRPQPWWRVVLGEARPLLVGAACSCLVMLAALSWSQQTPSAPRPALPSPTPLATTRPLDMAALDALLNRSELSAASLIEITAPADPSPSGRQRPTPPKRRVERLHAPLIA